ncbi:tRNA (adenosine(37)-N6)-threonylcarbamoyltransferase complex transferase subunit TsaD [Ruminococcus sp.]|uniref:tRNA (adenosine(37)-N6)-threonylcarbamoyltransferase complex transferase subunit TsaD n=1 Tax=Ruminococcus sp. TaxID=41978 RepID=UPI0025ED54D9|nr:tRNA (adenosine(37)-N6)-threonylcarbamoyltransferase complex transferase subunit TsaD [Ruminococcus sp.]MCI5816312.1 tRNA (adenosine(37)-N6)-threonylcarbamoyltransferase complex transferase subunit TsaD [Ruminococcus sp.]MDD7556921.1 tRNA (adenosine(37)-N6)-threonylcarbamoyltransferase complex transferase subunit TsaD [Ruminococcus sp.]MDY4963440.1 tRNA (adenosine(37)-N6)-threonylcarbamoyltransferase complex transferase subunit TsaD [Ruminococcus callidus]
MYILGIESSCDETAASVAVDGRDIRSNVVSSQIEEHKLYGGVVPEIASRRHCENVLGVVRQALEDAQVTLAQIDAIAVTYAPGLIGALLVGVSFAKGLAMATGKPLVPVHHISGHIAANYIAHPALEPPYLCLVASGGHSHIIEVRSHTEFRVVGRTRDDAAGECFDKCARVLGFPYPGGVHIDRAAREGNPEGYALPRPTVAGSAYDMSFSGLKTAVINLAHNAKQKGETLRTADLAASVQHRIAGLLTEKTMAAARDLGYRTIAAAGGVCANTGVRRALTEACEQAGCTLYLPPLSLCGDNGAMIACQGYFNYLAGMRAGPELNAVATLSIEDIGESLN